MKSRQAKFAQSKTRRKLKYPSLGETTILTSPGEGVSTGIEADDTLTAQLSSLGFSSSSITDVCHDIESAKMGWVYKI
jgi:hypothetical protein